MMVHKNLVKYFYNYLWAFFFSFLFYGKKSQFSCRAEISTEAIKIWQLSRKVVEHQGARERTTPRANLTHLERPRAKFSENVSPKKRISAKKTSQPKEQKEDGAST